MRIADREIGAELPPYIIAELGVNHDGSVDRALELTRAAAEAGADAVKLQLFETDRLMSKAAKLAAYQKAAGESDPITMLRRLELSIDDMARVVDLAHELKIHAIVTVFSVELVQKAETLAWDAYKTASPDIVHKPLLEALAATGKPMIVSTGASTTGEIASAADWLVGWGAAGRTAVLQCVSCYPTPVEQAELAGILTLRRELGWPTGYSDHTDSIEMGAWAVQAGACILEKHFTHSNRATGPDHAASLAPTAFGEYAEKARAGWKITRGRARERALGRPGGEIPLSELPGKRVLDIERDVRTVSRQSIVTTGPLSAGHALRREDLTFKRPGTGVLPFRIDEVTGKTLARAVEADVPLVEEDVAWGT